MPFFSIIIPVYNVAPYLRECLDSVLAQTFTDWEAICVDDGSADGSGSILDEYMAKDDRFRVIHQKNAGVSVARNVALDLSKGEWFLFLDGDDILRKDALGIFVPYLCSNKCDGILVQPYIPYWDGNNIPQRKVKANVLIQDATREDLLLGPYAANGFPFSRIYRTNVFRHVRFPVGVRMAEDVHFWYDALCVPARWMVLNAEYYLYRQREDSVCGQKNPKDCEAVLNSVLFALNKIQGEIGLGESGVHRYSRKCLVSPSTYLCIYVKRYKEVDAKSRYAIFAKAREMARLLGEWPFTRRLKIELWLIGHRLGVLMPLIHLWCRFYSSFLVRGARLCHYMCENGIGFALGKVKRQILRQG